MSVPTIFLSAASLDLGAWRNTLHGAFSRAGFRVIAQDHSIGSAKGGMRRLLVESIEEADCIIHLAGMAYGSDADKPFEDSPGFRCSWTQFEYYYAHSVGKDVIAFVCDPSLSASFHESGDAEERKVKNERQAVHRRLVRSGTFESTPLSAVPRTTNEYVASEHELLQSVASSIGALGREDPAYRRAELELSQLAEQVERIEQKQDRLLRRSLVGLLLLVALLVGAVVVFRSFDARLSLFSNKLEEGSAAQEGQLAGLREAVRESILQGGIVDYARRKGIPLEEVEGQFKRFVQLVEAAHDASENDRILAAFATREFEEMERKAVAHAKRLASGSPGSGEVVDALVYAAKAALHQNAPRRALEHLKDAELFLEGEGHRRRRRSVELKKQLLELALLSEKGRGPLKLEAAEELIGFTTASEESVGMAALALVSRWSIRFDEPTGKMFTLYYPTQAQLPMERDVFSATLDLPRAVISARREHDDPARHYLFEGLESQTVSEGGSLLALWRTPSSNHGANEYLGSDPVGFQEFESEQALADAAGIVRVLLEEVEEDGFFGRCSPLMYASLMNVSKAAVLCGDLESAGKHASLAFKALLDTESDGLFWWFLEEDRPYLSWLSERLAPAGQVWERESLAGLVHDSPTFDDLDDFEKFRIIVVVYRALEILHDEQAAHDFIRLVRAKAPFPGKEPSAHADLLALLPRGGTVDLDELQALSERYSRTGLAPAFWAAERAAVVRELKEHPLPGHLARLERIRDEVCAVKGSFRIPRTFLLDLAELGAAENIDWDSVSPGVAQVLLERREALIEGALERVGLPLTERTDRRIIAAAIVSCQLSLDRLGESLGSAYRYELVETLLRLHRAMEQCPDMPLVADNHRRQAARLETKYGDLIEEYENAEEEGE